MIISFKGNTGGGGYVLPTATDTRLGGVKVGSGLTIDSGGTLSAEGGTGGGDYIVTDALSSITNPTEGMIAYVPAHYEDRGATYVKYELNDTSENAEFWWPTFISIDNFYEWSGIQEYIFNATNNEKSNITFQKWGGYYVAADQSTSTEWLSPSYGSKVLVRISGATLEFLVNSGLTVSTNNPDDKFTITTSTGLTPVRGMTYVYHSGWLLKNVDFAYDRLQDYLPSLIHMSLNPETQSEFNFRLFRYNFDYVLWFGMDAQGNPGGWARFEFRCVEADDENRLQKFSAFVDSEAGNPWRFFAEASNYIKDLEFIRIPVLCEDAVLTEDIEYEGQIVAHSGDTVASAGTIVSDIDLFNQSDYWEEYRKHRIVFQFVKPGNCYWNNDLQKVIVDQGEEVKSYSDVLNLQRVPAENDQDDFYMSSIMNYNGTLYRGSWKQHYRYTRWITLSWETIMNHWVGTQAQYNALAPNYDNNTLYVIV